MEIISRCGEYLAPEIEVLSVENREVVCASVTDPFAFPKPEEIW